MCRSMTITAKVIQHSIGPAQVPLITFELRYPLFIHAEVLTHRLLSRSSASTRAIPTSKLIKSVLQDPARPVYWGLNRPGMSSSEELQGLSRWFTEQTWYKSRYLACGLAWGFTKMGLHKQLASRCLGPWQNITVIASATDWDNFFELRDHKDAQPEIQDLAKKMRTALSASKPNLLVEKEWHRPYIKEEDDLLVRDYLVAATGTNSSTASASPIFDNLIGMTLNQVSAARCARVSYLNHDGKRDIQKDVELYTRLVNSKHFSPLEHVAYAELYKNMSAPSNFRGWTQLRKTVSGG